MIRSAALLMSASLLASCGSGDQTAPPVQNDIMVRSDTQKRLLDLNALDRAIARNPPISDQGLRGAPNVSTPVVTRDNDKVFVSANDSVQVRLCADNEKIGLPACTIKPGTEGGTGLENLTENKAG